MIDYYLPNYSDLPSGRHRYQAYATPVPGGNATVDVSIVTPYFNTGEIFRETVESVLRQSLQNWEWVIVDDGSTDRDSVEFLYREAARDSRIHVVRQDNSGPSAARNFGFSQSNGRYICLLDSDDLLEPTYFEKCAWFLDANPEFAFCNSFSVVFGDQQYLWTNGFERNKDVIKANSGPPISMIRREAYADIGGFDADIRFGHEDWDFWLAMADHGHWGYTIREFLQWYRKRGNGRFEQIMRSGTVNAEFELQMTRKYANLDQRFPNPQRHHASPYEPIPITWAIHNTLPTNPDGRRILFVLPWMVIGGADRVNLDLIEGLISRGHQISVCATLTADQRWEHKFAQLTPDVFVLPNFLRTSDYPRFLHYLIESRRIDSVVITASTIGYQLLPYLRAVAPEVAFVDLSHVEEPHWLNGGHPRFGAGYQDALDLNIVSTEHLARWMTGIGADPTRIRVLHTGIRPPETPASAKHREVIRARFGIVGDKPLILFAGRICAQKRPAVLAEILKVARDDGLAFDAVIIGDGELRPEFEALLREYHLLNCVHVVGALPHEHWLEVLVACDILLMPSEYEGISIALLEAMSAGIVPVVARVGGQEEIVRPDAGYLIAHGEEEVREYVTALRSLILQPDELRKRSEICRSLIQTKFSWSETINTLERILSEAHANRATRRCVFSPAIGRELATTALECKRLGDAVDWLWNTARSAENPSNSLATNHQSAPLVRLAILFSETSIGRVFLKSTFLKKLGRALLTKLESTQ